MTTLSIQQLHDEWERQYVGEGLSSAKIAAQHRVAKSTVLKALHARGVVRSSRGQRICSVPGCSEIARTRGMCPKHYQRWLKHGQPVPQSGDAPSLPGEEWRSIEGFGGYYQISSFGRVYSVPRMVMSRSGIPRQLRGRLLKMSPDAYGYPRVSLLRNGERRHAKVHQLVAEAFIGPQPDGTNINHVDGDKANNVSTNLEWTTPSENIRHGYQAGLIPRGSAHERAKLTEGQVRAIREQLARGARPDDIAAEFGVSPGAIYSIKHGKNWAWLD